MKSCNAWFLDLESGNGTLHSGVTWSVLFVQSDQARSDLSSVFVMEKKLTKDVFTCNFKAKIVKDRK